MTLVYPVAVTVEAALHAPLGFAAREREAVLVAGEAVSFVTELVGPAFATPAAAEEAYAGVDGARGRQLAPVADGRLLALRRPVYQEGRRWAQAEAVAAVLWRLSLSYWRVGVAPALSTPPPRDAARKMRRAESGRELDAPTLAALARQPLRAVKPQQPLDIGLFEVSLPEAPGELMPDE